MHRHFPNFKVPLTRSKSSKFLGEKEKKINEKPLERKKEKRN